MCDECQFNHKNIFKSNYELKGRDWLKSVSKEDRQVFIDIGRRHNQSGKLGGAARAARGKRDKRGRFIKEKDNG